MLEKYFYEVICKDCGCYDDRFPRETIMDEVFDETEYIAKQRLSRLNHHCLVCGSNNLEPIHIIKQGSRLYTWEKTVLKCRNTKDLINLQVKKDDVSGYLEFSKGGSEPDLSTTYLRVLSLLLEEIDKIEETKCKRLREACLDIVAIDGFDYVLGKNDTHIESLMIYGFTKEELYSAINLCLTSLRLNLSIDCLRNMSL